MFYFLLTIFNRNLYSLNQWLYKGYLVIWFLFPWPYKDNKKKIVTSLFHILKFIMTYGHPEHWIDHWDWDRGNYVSLTVTKKTAESMRL